MFIYIPTQNIFIPIHYRLIFSTDTTIRILFVVFFRICKMRLSLSSNHTVQTSFLVRISKNKNTEYECIFQLNRMVASKPLFEKAMHAQPCCNRSTTRNVIQCKICGFPWIAAQLIGIQCESVVLSLLLYQNHQRGNA